jgi:hypothetical protein
MKILRCIKCDGLLKEDFDYCPYCGNKCEHYRMAYKIGDKGPSGGIIFYDKGNRSHGWQYLESAPNDITNVYGSSGNLNISTSKEIGKGKENTDTIVTVLKDTAVQLCANYKLNGYDDWFLPSENELDLMYLNLKKNGLGNFTDDNYWSSTQIETGDSGEEELVAYDDSGECYEETVRESNLKYWTAFIDFRNGVHLIGGKLVGSRARPIRAF